MAESIFLSKYTNIDADTLKGNTGIAFLLAIVPGCILILLTIMTIMLYVLLYVYWIRPLRNVSVITYNLDEEALLSDNQNNEDIELYSRKRTKSASDSNLSRIGSYVPVSTNFGFV